MPAHITTAEAKKNGLSGHDSFKYSHLLYHDDINRNEGVLRLNLEAMRAFLDTVMIKRRHELAQEQAAVKEWSNKGNFTIPYPWGEAMKSSAMYVNYENLKLAAGFELHLKARLLACDYIVHEIDSRVPGYKDIASEQASRPILKQELFAIQQYHFDGRQNYLPGLKEKSLIFSLLTNQPNYRAALELTQQQLDIIEDFRNLRNQIHYPGDIVDAPNIMSYPGSIADFIATFINNEIVDWSNLLIAKSKCNWKQFQQEVFQKLV